MPVIEIVIVCTLGMGGFILFAFAGAWAGGLLDQRIARLLSFSDDVFAGVLSALFGIGGAYLLVTAGLTGLQKFVMS